MSLADDVYASLPKDSDGGVDAIAFHRELDRRQGRAPAREPIVVVMSLPVFVAIILIAALAGALLWSVTQ